MKTDKIIAIDTTGLKWALFALSVFVGGIVFASAIYSGQPAYNSMFDAVIVFTVFILPLWIYGEVKIYHMRYVFSERCLSIYKRERLIEEIEWHKIIKVDPPLTLVTNEGRRIHIRIMRSQMSEAHSIIHTKIAHDLNSNNP